MIPQVMARALWMQVAELFVELACQHEPAAVLPFLQVSDSYSVSRVLGLCRRHQHIQGQVRAFLACQPSCMLAVRSSMVVLVSCCGASKWSCWPTTCINPSSDGNIQHPVSPLSKIDRETASCNES